MTELPSATRTSIGGFLARTWEHGRRHDRFWVLEIAELAGRTTATRLLGEGLRSPSALLREEAYRQAGSSGVLTLDMRADLRRSLATQWAEGVLKTRRAAVRAQIERVDDPKGLHFLIGALRVVPAVDVVLSLVAAVLFVAAGDAVVPAVTGEPIRLVLTVLVFSTLARVSFDLLCVSSHLSWASRPRGVSGRALDAVGLVKWVKGKNASRSFGFFGAVVRLLLVVSPLWFIWDERSWDGWTAAAAAGIVVCAVSGPTLLFLLVSGRWRVAVSWPFIHLADFWRARSVDVGLIVLGLVLLGGVLALPLGLAFAITVEVRDRPWAVGTLWSFGWVDWGMVVVLTALFLALLAFAVDAIPSTGAPAPRKAAKKVSRKDRAMAERLLRSVEVPLAMGDLIKIFEGYTRDSFMLEVLIKLRRSGIFQAAPDVVAFMGDLGASVELGRRDVAMPAASGSSEAFAKWWTKTHVREPMVRTMSDDTLDQIAQVMISSPGDAARTPGGRSTDSSLRRTRRR